MKKKNRQRRADPPPEGMSKGRYIGGLAVLAFALAMCLVLAAHHISGMSLPGCGTGSGCDQLAATAWGRVPGTSWPVAFVGAAYFAALLAGWFGSRPGLHAALRHLIRVGAALSIMYAVVMVVLAKFCSYCTAVHVANVTFWIIAEWTRRPAASPRRPLIEVAAVFAVISAGLGIVESRRAADVAVAQETAFSESVDEILRTSEESNEDASAKQPDQPTDSEAAASPWPGDFTGRYRIGPELARVRLVMFMDYQCPDCRRIEGDAFGLCDENEDVSLSVKHFPMCTDFNPHFPAPSLHPNACWAAR
ncbi:MAG: vitamin K epoxide reductase family protein, partial [Phycisphaerae bacterium]